MKVGTKSVLFGYHCVFIHWLFVARGWFHLYGFQRVAIGSRTFHFQPAADDLPQLEPGTARGVTVTRKVYTSLLDPRLWIAFIIHDLGYWGKPNMDGAEGERHPEWACGRMNAWFDAPWGAFVLLHSRFYAKKMGLPVSPLCFADKLAIVYMPDWLYLPLIRATGEVEEYMQNVQKSFGDDGKEIHPSAKAWLHDVKDYVRKWVKEHKDGRDDTWTPGGAQRLSEYSDTGVWK